MRRLSFVILTFLTWLNFNTNSYASAENVRIDINLKLGQDVIKSQMISTLGVKNVSSSNKYIIEVKPERIETPHSPLGDQILVEIKVLHRNGNETKLLLNSSLVTLNNIGASLSGAAENTNAFELKVTPHLN